MNESTVFSICLLCAGVYLLREAFSKLSLRGWAVTIAIFMWLCGLVVVSGSHSLFHPPPATIISLVNREWCVSCNLGERMVLWRVYARKVLMLWPWYVFKLAWGGYDVQNDPISTYLATTVFGL